MVVIAVAYGRGNDAGGGKTSQATEKSWAGTAAAPAIPTGLTWFNVEQPLTLDDLRGKVVLLDFWTLGCINCQHIIPDLKRLEDEFHDSLVVIGVHSGKYATEHDDDAVREAVQRYGLTHPVVNDPDFAVWDTFGSHAWPTLVLIDPAGNIVGGHAGEGVYPLFQPIVASLVKEFEAKGELDRAKTIPVKLDAAVSPAVLSFPGKVLADPKSGRLFIADSGHNRVLVATMDGVLQQAFGSGKEGFADGAPSEAQFRQPQGLALSEDGRTLYVADTRNHAVRALNLASGETTTIAGTGEQLDRLPGKDAQAKSTALASPWDVVAVGQSLFISMAGTHQIWALDLAKGTIAVFAGTSREGIDDGDRLQMATLAQPSGITTDGHYLYWVDPEASAVRRTLLSGSGEVETMVGTGLFDYGNQDGQGKQAKLQHPQGIAYANGKLYVGDTYNHEIRVIDTAKFAVSTLAGHERGWTDGTGTSARFDEPGGLSVAGANVYVADTNNHLVRAVSTGAGDVSTLTLSNLAVLAPSAPARKATLDLPGQRIAPGATNVRVSISAPAGYHLNSQAPSKVALVSSNPSVLQLGENELTWSSDDSQVSFPVPAVLGTGSATLTATASVYYCRTGEEALCFIQQTEIRLPIDVAVGAGASEPTIDYRLPGSPG